MSPRQQIRFCRAADGVRIAYATVGSGPPLVKTGNWMAHLELDLEGPIWGPLLRELAVERTVLRYDQRGTGLSDWEVQDVSFDAWLSDLEMVVDAAGFERFPLLGLSQGVALAIAYAHRHPERVSHLVLHGGYARGRLRRGGGPAAEEEAAATYQLIELGWAKDEAAYREFFSTQVMPGATRGQRDWLNEMHHNVATPRMAARMMQAYDHIDVSPLLVDIACPVLVSHVAADLRVPFAESELMARQMGHARLVSLRGHNHFVLPGDPMWQFWFDTIREFLGAPDRPVDQRFALLTARERELLELVAQGRDNAQVAAVMQLSEKTVRNHITSVFAKLKVDNRSQAIVTARQAGFGMQSGGKPR